jgi:superfamily II DNA helicase RecQ
MATAGSTIDESIEYSFSKLVTEFDALKQAQQQAVKAVLEGNYVFVRLPTGFSRSIIVNCSSATSL